MVAFSGGDKSDAARGNRAQSFASSPAMIREYDILLCDVAGDLFKHCFPLANIVEGNGFTGRPSKTTSSALRARFLEAAGSKMAAVMPLH